MKLRDEEAQRESALSAAIGPEGGGDPSEGDPFEGDPTLKSVTRKLIERQELYNGFGKGLALAFELALTPAIFGLIGYGLDRWLGTLPVFTIVGVLACVVGLGVRQFYGYDAQMKVHEAAGPWARKPDPDTQHTPPEWPEGP